MYALVSVIHIHEVIRLPIWKMSSEPCLDDGGDAMFISIILVFRIRGSFSFSKCHACAYYPFQYC